MKFPRVAKKVKTVTSSSTGGENNNRAIGTNTVHHNSGSKGLKPLCVNKLHKMNMVGARASFVGLAGP